VDRELLLEIGCEELPASWLPGLTDQIGLVTGVQLREHRLPPEAPIETFSTPRRLTVRVARVPERQTDFEEMISGPPVSASFGADGAPTSAASGFAAKHGVAVSALERTSTPKGEYLAFRKHLRGKATADVLPRVLEGTLRSLTFPKLMRWDAMLDDGKGELPFGRPIRWLLFTYGGRVVPFNIGRLATAATSAVQDVASGAVTYGHRFLTTSGRAGRAVKVRSFDDYRARLLENFVILERSERHDKIVRELDAKAVRLKGRVSRAVRADAALLDEVPDLVEYPAVIAGTFSPEFAQVLPDEVLTTTLVHHQHYFPVEGEDGKLKPAFLAVINTEPENERVIAANAERVVTARLRDAMFFWQADRRSTLESRVERLSTLLFHKKLGSYKEKAERVERLAAWIASEAIGASADAAKRSAVAGRLAKADLTTDMVREFTELQGTMGGIYAREEGLPEPVWKAIYYHYAPIAIEPTAPPTRDQLGAATETWAAVSLADKLDTIVGLFGAGERPTGSRDPYGLRRAAHGVLKILVDLPELLGRPIRPTLDQLLAGAARLHGKELKDWEPAANLALRQFMIERLNFVLESRGFDVRNVRAVTGFQRYDAIRPADELRKLQVLPEFTETEDFRQLANAVKRARNIARALPPDRVAIDEQTPQDLSALREPAELALSDELHRRGQAIDRAVESGDGFREAFSEAAKLKPAVDKFFDDVLVMVKDDDTLRNARLTLLNRLDRKILKLADVQEIVPEEGRSV
jgi:glycyl-tRNA synthetase beta chain